MTTNQKNTPIFTCFGKKVVLHLSSDSDDSDSDSESIGEPPWNIAEKGPIKDQETLETVGNIMVERKEYLATILRKNDTKKESLKDASATKLSNELNHCDERMYCIEEEIQQIDKILTGFDKIKNGVRQKDTPVIILISTYLSQRIDAMEVQYDCDVDGIDTYRRLQQQIEHIIRRHTKEVQQLNIPYILIDSTLHQNNSVFFRIYDYLTYTAQIIENNIQLYNGDMNSFRVQHPDEADNLDVLARWDKPINEWTEELAKLTKFQKHLKKILHNTDQPAVGDLLGEKYNIPIEFFPDLHEYISLKQKQMMEVPMLRGNSPLKVRENAVRIQQIQIINNFEQITDKWNKEAKQKNAEMMGGIRKFSSNKSAKRTKMT